MKDQLDIEHEMDNLDDLSHTHEWSAGMMIVHEEDADDISRERPVECTMCDLTWMEHTGHIDYPHLNGCMPYECDACT